MKPELLDRVCGWVASAIERNLVPTDGGTCEGGFCFDGVDYLLTCWPGDNGVFETVVQRREAVQ